MKITKYFNFILILTLLTSCSTIKIPLETVPNVELDKYAGLWYEIAHLPFSFQKNCQCSTAEYTLTEKKYVRVVNSCFNTKKNKWIDAKGKAFVVPNSNNSKLKVQFFWPFQGDYQIIKLGSNYEYAVVGSPNRETMWILSRDPDMKESLYQDLVSKMKMKKFPVEELIKTTHDCR